MNTVASLPREQRLALVGRVVELLNASVAFRKPDLFAIACVVIRGPGEASYVTSRGCFASWLQNNALPNEARECRNRRLRRGQTLVWLEIDVPDVSCAGFLVVDVLAEARALRGAA